MRMVRPMPDYKSARDKAERTNAAASEAIEVERLAREKKTAKLRALRIARESVEKSRPKTGRSGSR
jgi:hypothetical protein